MSDKTNPLQALPDTLTEEPVAITLDILPRNKYHQWAQENKYLSKYFPRKKTYQIRPITYANLQRISKLLVAIDGEGIIKAGTLNEIGLPMLAEHGDTVPRIIAIAITNGRSMPPKSLVEELKYSLTTKESLFLVGIVLRQMDIQSFLTTIIYSKGMRLQEEGKKSEEKSKGFPQK
jgi:hypothetical protein